MFKAFVLLLIMSVSLAEQILVTFGVPQNAKHKVGLYWTGNPNSPKISSLKPWFGNSDSTEMLVNVIDIGQTQSEQIFDGAAFVIRSADLTTRMRVSISFNKNHEDRERPFTISLVNLSIEDRSGPYPVELQHSDAGYVWIDPTDVVEHITGQNHIFTIRDKTKSPVFSVTINGAAGKEL